MARFVERIGDLLEADVDALTNTVNTMGVMGKGIALAFKGAFPENFEAYRTACERGEVKLGEMFVFENRRDDGFAQLKLLEEHSGAGGVEPYNGVRKGPRWIVNFPTKRHWRAGSRMADVESGLDNLYDVIRNRRIASIAVPALGCGLGGLDWGRVRPLIERKLDDLDVEVHLYPPDAAVPSRALSRAH